MAKYASVLFKSLFATLAGGREFGIGNTSYDLFYDGGDSLVQLPPLWWGPFLSKTYLTLLLVLRRING